MVNDFPKLNSYIYLDGLTFEQSGTICHKDLSFVTHYFPTRSENSGDTDYFNYHTMKFSTKSHFKMSAASANADTISLKEIVKDKK